MASRTYQNFDLLLEAADGGGFRARVTSSPLGESPTGRFSLPFDGTQLENLLLKLDPGRSGTRRAGSDPQTQASMDLGGPLFETVFCEDIMLAWQRSQDYAREQGDGLRLRLRLTDAPSIAGLPWELLYDRRGNSFIAQSERTPVVRYLEVPQPPRPLAVDGALRILVVISSPTDLPELDVEAEWRRVQDALAGKVAQGTVKIDRLPAPTIQALSAWLRQHDVHVLHFIGHGDYDDRIQDGVVYFQDRYGRSSKVSPTVLGPYLRDHDPLRLVLLNACQSARVDTTDPFSGMAQGLVQQDCTAVVAMQFPISDGAATTFTGEFYGALADGFPVDQAATSARKALIAEYAAEWATPVLFLRAPDGRVFDHIVAQPAVTAVPTPPPVVDDVEMPVVTGAATTQTKRRTGRDATPSDGAAAKAADPAASRGAAATSGPVRKDTPAAPTSDSLRGVAAAAGAVTEAPTLATRPSPVPVAFSAFLAGSAEQPDSAPSRRRGPRVAAAVLGVGVLLAAMLVLKSSGLAADATSAAGSGSPVTQTVTASTSVSPTATSPPDATDPARPSSPAVPSVKAPASTPSAEAAARAELDRLYATDRDHLSTDSHWVIQLASKWNGVTDPRTSKTYQTTDILEEVQNLKAKFRNNVILVQSTDLGLQRTYPNKPAGEPLWVVLYDPGTFSASRDADAWCASTFPALTGDSLRNVCLPRKAEPPHG
jgi:CHAT domain